MHKINKIKKKRGIENVHLIINMSLKMAFHGVQFIYKQIKPLEKHD